MQSLLSPIVVFILSRLIVPMMCFAAKVVFLTGATIADYFPTSGGCWSDDFVDWAQPASH